MFGHEQWTSLEEQEEEEEEDAEDVEVKVGVVRNNIWCIKAKFKWYSSQLPILGFKLACYNLHLVKTSLAKHLDLAEKSNCVECFEVTKASAYLFISLGHDKLPGTRL